MPSPQPAPLDGVQASNNLAPQQVPAALVTTKKIIAALFGMLMVLYVLWCVVLLSLLPDQSGKVTTLAHIGLLSVPLSAALILALGLFLLRRIALSTSSPGTKRLGIVKIAVVVLPVLILAVFTSVLIIQEPRLSIDVVDPPTNTAYVAPLTITFAAEKASNILQNRGLQVLKYQWDTDGDGTMNEETVLPRSSALYQRQGVYVVAVRLVLQGGTTRTLKRQLLIPQQVFSIEPSQPVVEKSVKLSVLGLLSDIKQLKSVEWSFGDGSPSVQSAAPDVSHIFYAPGTYAVGATVLLQNQSKTLYKKNVTVTAVPPLPFPIEVVSEPKTLLGPSPFGAIFRVHTDIPLSDVAWNFGDGKEDHGAQLLRTSHVFDSPGIYPVTVRARAVSGSLAEIVSVVRVTDVLPLRDVKFTGSSSPLNGAVKGESPLSIELTPTTSTPLVQFTWEVADDVPLQAENGILRGVLRDEGTYTVTLVAEGAEGKSARLPITFTVTPPTAEPNILLSPDGGTAPLAVDFDASQTFIPPGETIAGFRWLFGDERQGAGKSPEVGAARVQHTYNTPGEFTVNLAVILTSGKEFSVQRTIVVRKPVVIPCITPSRLTVEVGKGVEFDSSCSTAIDGSQRTWDVRSASEPTVVLAQGTGDVYVHVFNTPGEYVVTVSLSDQWSKEQKTSVTISVTP
jgi:PKD repeat protein